ELAVVAALEEHARPRQVVRGADDDDPAPTLVLREPRHGLRLAARAVRHRLEADDLEAGMRRLAVAEPDRGFPPRVPEGARDGEDGGDSALDELECRIEARVPAAREDDHRVRVRGRR